MPRLSQVPRDKAHEGAQRMYQALFGERDPLAQPGTATGTPGNWWTVFALVPEVFDHAVAGFGVYRSPRRKLDPRLRELAQTRAGFARGSQFVFSQHCKAARDVGLGEDQIAALPHWQVATCYSSLERAVLAYTDALVLEGGRVPDGVFAALRAGLDDEQILELTYITCLYEMHATMTRALRLEYDDVPERVVEVPAPSAAGDPPAAEDPMKAVDRAR
jgi:alkylhydroperoxidase family enzyme